jgi:hypothetical protein
MLEVWANPAAAKKISGTKSFSVRGEANIR